MKENLVEFHKKDKLCNDRTVELICSGRDVVQLVEMDDRIRDRMSAIDIAARLLDSSPPAGSMYVFRHIEPNWRWTSQTKLVLVNVGYQKSEFVINAPTFLWNIRKNYHVDHFILECNDDFTLKYPIKNIKVQLLKTGEFQIDEEELDIEGCIERLDEIIERV